MELFSGKSTSGKTVSTNPGLCRGLKLSDQLHLMVGRMVQLHMWGGKEAINDGTGNDYTFVRRSERLVASYNEESVSRDGDNVGKV